MMRSLWSGVSGLQAHQIAMDVEGNNIANVNTNGFKYSRANFSDMLSQTSKIATAPQGTKGGSNPVQVGLGTEVSSITRMFSQGSIQTTGKNTDLAIQGNGFFVVSPDGGKTYKYTRSGDFVSDANGNFVTNSGLIAQGWNRDPVTGAIDSTAPISNISIPPGLTTPANETSIINVKANLNAGNNIVNKSPIRTLDSTAGILGADGVSNTKDDEFLDDFNVLFNTNGEAFNLKTGSAVGVGGEGINVSFDGGALVREFRYTDGSLNSVGLSSVATGQVDVIKMNATGVEANDTYTWKDSVSGATVTITATTGNESASDLATLMANAINAADFGNGVNGDFIADASAGDGTFKITAVDTNKAFSSQTSSPTDASNDNIDPLVTSTTPAKSTYYFRTTEDLRAGLQAFAANTSTGATVTVNNEGKFELANPNTSGTDMNLQVSSIVDANTNENYAFTTALKSFAGQLTAGSSGIKVSQEINAATHSASIDVFDSLGSKHTVRINFRKEGYVYDTSGTKTGSSWKMQILVPEPGNIGGIINDNELDGQIIFNSDGSLSAFTPTSITYTANNGSAPNQTIQLNLGTANQFDGLTSFDNNSNTSGISQDGYTGGDLQGIRVDQSGSLIGSFTNGRSFGLAQLAMARFTNDIGLESDGGNIFIQTANSGDPVIGQASSGGRGFIQASALEMSNVDLSRSLTQLIVIQRGFQANSKTITTSDQMLNTLLQLKQ